MEKYVNRILQLQGYFRAMQVKAMKGEIRNANDHVCSVKWHTISSRLG
jgi:hypothetical protein